MRMLTFIAGLFIFSLTLKAAYDFEAINYCTWMGIAANVIAMNRDLGIDQDSLIGNYLEQGDEYEEQVVIISLIEHIYGSQKHKDVDMVTLETESACLGARFNS